jgi:hypothetical protein
MSDCANYRRSMLADPLSRDPALRAHRDNCRECAGFADRLAIFETRISRAMRWGRGANDGAGDGTTAGASAISSPSRAVHRELPQRRRGPAARWLAIAASVLVAVGAAAILWVAVPRASLAQDVVAHMADEPQAWRITDAAVNPGRLAGVLQDAHLRLGSDAGLVSYANSCAFRGHDVPHLVVQDGANPVTVMVLVHEHAPKPVSFDEQGYRGFIVPIPGHGALAVLTHGPHADPAAALEVAARVLGAIVWTE